jgi:hypothetical protein
MAGGGADEPKQNEEDFEIAPTLGVKGEDINN